MSFHIHFCSSYSFPTSLPVGVSLQSPPLPTTWEVTVNQALVWGLGLGVFFRRGCPCLGWRDVVSNTLELACCDVWGLMSSNLRPAEWRRPSKHQPGRRVLVGFHASASSAWQRCLPPEFHPHAMTRLFRNVRVGGQQICGTGLYRLFHASSSRSTNPSRSWCWFSLSARDGQFTGHSLCVRAMGIMVLAVASRRGGATS